MFAIFQYVVKLVIKTRIFIPVARQLALTWRAVSTQIGLKCYHPCMKRKDHPVLSYGTF